MLLRGVGDRACAGDRPDRDRRALREAPGIHFLRDRVQRLHVRGGSEQVEERDRRDTVLEVVLVGACRELAGVVQYGLVLRVCPDLLEGWDRHSGQEADDDDDNHDFDEGKALGITFVHIHLLSRLSYGYRYYSSY